MRIIEKDDSNSAHMLPFRLDLGVVAVNEYATLFEWIQFFIRRKYSKYG